MSSAARVLPFNIEEAPRTSQQKPQLSSSTKCVLHEVKHGHFKWSIENFTCFPPTNDQYIQSPIFELDVSWWYLALHPKIKMCGQDMISLILMRHKSDPGPQMVAVSYKLGLEGGDNKVWFKPEEREIFLKGDVHVIQTSTLGHLEDFLEEGFRNDNDVLSVLCELYVCYERSDSNLKEFFYDLDVDLPINMQRLFQSESRSDLLILTPKARARAHKCVLSARSKTLARLLEDGKSVIEINCSLSCLSCILNYIYCGNLIFLTKNVVYSIGLYELACELSLSKLRDYLTPWKIELRSHILVEECSSAFAFYSLSEDEILAGNIESRVHVDKGTGIGIKLRLQQTTSSGYVEFCVEVSGVTRALYFLFDLYILNENSDGIDVIPAKSLKDPDVSDRNLIAKYSVGFPLYDILNFSAHGNLYLNLFSKLYSLKHLPHHSLNNIEKPPTSSYLKWHKDLSSDMIRLFNRAYFSDLTLVASDSAIKAHRCILGTRSEYFRAGFHNDHYKTRRIMLDVGPHTLYLMLLYIYSGKISINKQRISIEYVLDLYKASEKYKIPSLGNILSKYLVLNLDESFVFEAFDTAELHGNTYLSVECKKYITQHDLKRESAPEETEEKSSDEDFWEDSEDEEEPDEECSNEESSNEDSPDDGTDGNSPDEGAEGEESPNEDSLDEGTDETRSGAGGTGEESSNENSPDEGTDGNHPDRSAPVEESNEELPDEGTVRNLPDEGAPGEESTNEDSPDEGTDENRSGEGGTGEESSNENSPDESTDRNRPDEGGTGQDSSNENSPGKGTDGNHPNEGTPDEESSNEDLPDEGTDRNRTDERAPGNDTNGNCRDESTLGKESFNKGSSDKNSSDDGTLNKNQTYEGPLDEGSSKAESPDEKKLACEDSLNEALLDENLSGKNTSDEEPSHGNSSHEGMSGRNCPGKSLPDEELPKKHTSTKSKKNVAARGSLGKGLANKSSPEDSSDENTSNKNPSN